MSHSMVVPTVARRDTPITPREATAMDVAKLEQGVREPQYVRDIIKFEEGVHPRVYLDTKWSKKPTIGVGFNMNRKSAREKFKTIGADYGLVRHKNIPLTKDQIEHLFDLSLMDAYRDVKKLVPSFYSLAPSRQAALIDMAFNMGRRKLGGFDRTLQAVSKGDWEKASKEIMNSEYGRKLPGRAKRNAARMLMPMSEFTPPKRGRAK